MMLLLMLLSGQDDMYIFSVCLKKFVLPVKEFVFCGE